jgi:hypothetical protein
VPTRADPQQAHGKIRHKKRTKNKPYLHSDITSANDGHRSWLVVQLKEAVAADTVLSACTPVIVKKKGKRSDARARKSAPGIAGTVG